jgi:hypothetical protein
MKRHHLCAGNMLTDHFRLYFMTFRHRNKDCIGQEAFAAYRIFDLDVKCTRLGSVICVLVILVRGCLNKRA